jgi:L-amino acid N-acyltransferase YncA
MTIRLAKQDDLSTIVDIYNSTIDSRMVTADLTPVSVESRLPWFLSHKPKTRPIFVKIQNNQVIAWLSFQDFYGRLAYQYTSEISLYVDNNFRGKKIGSQLLEYGLNQCPQLKIKTVLGFIFGHNQPSLNLFKKFGFQQWGNFPKIAELDTIERDLIILGKRIYES